MNTKPKRKRKYYSFDHYENPLDERQKALSNKITIRSLMIFSVLALANAWVVEFCYDWSESLLNSNFIFAGIGLLYDRIKSAAAGCLFGIKGAKDQTLTTVILIFSAVISIYDALWFGAGYNAPFAVIREGKLTKEFEATLYGTLFLISSLITLFFIIRETKAKKRAADNSKKDA